MRWGVLILFFQLVAICLTALAEPENAFSELNHVVQRVFTRQKRFLIFLKGANMKFTGSISKSVIARFPKGVNMALEEALYYPVPRSREDLYPKAFKTKTTEAPKISTTQSYVWIPGTNWRFKAQHVPPYQLVPFKPLGYERPPPKPKHRIDVSPPTYANNNKWQKWSKYGQNNTYWRPEYEHYKKYKYAQVEQPAANMKWRKRPTGSSKYDHYIDNWTSHGQHGQSWKSDVPDKWSKWTTVSPKWTNYGNRWYRDVEQSNNEEKAEFYDPHSAPYELYDYADLTPLRDWRHYHAHRDRRQLFDQLSGFSRLLGFDVKTCILRAMCDSKRLLLPPGYSMMQDIIRLIFTMPTITGVDDEYSQAMRMDPEHCAQHFRQQCKVDILAWLFSGH